MPNGPDNRGKQALFEEVAMSHFSGIYYAALRLTGNQSDAEDLVQETFARAYGSFGSFTLGTNARAWLYKIMNITFLTNIGRAEARYTRAFSATPPERLAGVRDPASPDPAEVVIANTLDSRLSAALAGLSVEMRSTVVIVDVGGFSYEEASQILGCPVGTVRSRLFRGRSALRTQLTEGATELMSDPMEGQHE